MVHLCHTLKKEESERVTAHPENDSFFKILKGSLFIRPPKRYKFSKFSLGSMYIPFHYKVRCSWWKMLKLKSEIETMSRKRERKNTEKCAFRLDGMRSIVHRRSS